MKQVFVVYEENDEGHRLAVAAALTLTREVFRRIVSDHLDSCKGSPFWGPVSTVQWKCQPDHPTSWCALQTVPHAHYVILVEQVPLYEEDA